MLLLHYKDVNGFHYFKYYLLKKMLLCILKWFAGLFLCVSNHCLWCNFINWAKLVCVFSNDYHDLKWEYSTYKQHETGRKKSSTKEQCEVFFENYFSLLNNCLDKLNSNWFFAEEPIISFLEIIFILLL